MAMPAAVTRPSILPNDCTAFSNAVYEYTYVRIRSTVSSLWTVFDMGHQTHRQAGLVADVCLEVVDFDIKLFRKAVYVL